MKAVKIADIINEINYTGSCYIGNEEIMGWKYIENQIRKVRKAIHDAGYEIYFTTEEREGKEWYAVAQWAR